MASGIERVRFFGMLTFLIVCMLLLASRLFYFVLADASRFPINTVKIAANYQHITRQQLEKVLSPYLRQGFFGFSTSQLEQDLLALNWSQMVSVSRVWPDTVKITLVEKNPIALWNGALMTESGDLFRPEKQTEIDEGLPFLSGPESQRKDVLQIYQKLSKLVSLYGLTASTLQLRENQAWELSLSNGVLLRLGKRDLETRLKRFCRAYPAVFADKPEQLTSVDLRYARGMAVQWKQQMGR